MTANDVTAEGARTATKKRAKPQTKRRAATPAEPPDPHAWRLVNRVQLAALLGVHPDTVTDYARNAMPVVERGGHGQEGVYDAVECLEWHRQQQGRNLKEAAQTRALTAQATLNEIKIAREAGDLVPRDQVVAEGQAYTKAWSAKVRSLPRRLAQLGVITRKDEGRVADLCREVLTEIAGWRTEADLNAAGRKAKGKKR